MSRSVRDSVRVPAQTGRTSSYQYGHHPMITGPETRSAHLFGRFFPAQQSHEHVVDQRLSTAGLIAKPWVPGNNEPINSTNRAELQWKGFPTDSDGYYSAKPAPREVSKQTFSGTSTHRESFAPKTPVDRPGVRVHHVQEPRIPAYEPHPVVTQSVAKSTFVAHPLEKPMTSPTMPLRSSSRVECRSTQRETYTAHTINYPPPKRVGPAPPTSKENSLYIEHHVHQPRPQPPPELMRSMSQSSFVAHAPAPAAPPPTRARKAETPFTATSSSRDHYQAWPVSSSSSASFHSVTLPEH